MTLIAEKFAWIGTSLNAHVYIYIHTCMNTHTSTYYIYARTNMYIHTYLGINTRRLALIGTTPPIRAHFRRTVEFSQKSARYKVFYVKRQKYWIFQEAEAQSTPHKTVRDEVVKTQAYHLYIYRCIHIQICIIWYIYNDLSK